MTIRQHLGAWFTVAVAAIAAACANLLTEGLADRGAFGHAPYTDGSNADVMPVVCVGAVFMLRFLYLRVRRALRIDEDLVSTAVRLSRELTPAAMGRRLPLIFAAQIGVLWLMETAEQFTVVGHGFGGTVWLGGPPAISLAVHALLCVVTACAARGVLRALEPRALRLIRALFGLLGVTGAARRPRCGRRAAPLLAVPSPVRCRIGVRAPPATVS